MKKTETTPNLPSDDEVKKEAFAHADRIGDSRRLGDVPVSAFYIDGWQDCFTWLKGYLAKAETLPSGLSSDDRARMQAIANDLPRLRNDWSGRLDRGALVDDFCWLLAVGCHREPRLRS